MTTPDSRRMVATHALDQLDAALDELGHWLVTGERVTCPRCHQIVPAAQPGQPGRHQIRGQWCEVQP